VLDVATPPPLTERDRPLDPRPASEYGARTDARVVVVDRDGISLVDTDEGVDRDFSTRPEIALALTGTQSSGTRSSETLATDLLYVAVPVASGGTVHGALRVTLDTSDVTARIERFWLALATVAVVVLVAVALIGWGVARSVTRPLRRLNTAAARFAQGDLTVGDDPHDGPPELRALAETMTRMARRLDDLLQAQRAFVADASHQLRTPLTALRLRLENLQSGLAEGSSAELDAAIDETSRLATLVTDLLQLARTDEHPASGVADLAQLTADRVDTWTAVAEAKAVILLHDAFGGPALVRVIPGAIEQILDSSTTQSTPHRQAPRSPYASRRRPTPTSSRSPTRAPASPTSRRPMPPDGSGAPTRPALAQASALPSSKLSRPRPGDASTSPTRPTAGSP
jgi:signal transduction histidine kinase